MNKKQRKFRKKRQHAHAESSQIHDKKLHVGTIDSPTDQKIPLWTVTGELFQPIRIYYNVFKLQKVLKVFNKLECMEFDSSHKHWTWLYIGESSQITLNKKNINPTKPIVLGSFFTRGERKMYLDVHSIERALEAIPFFDKYISRRIAKISHLSVVNRLFEAGEAHTFTFDSCFEADSGFDDPIKSLLQTFDSVGARTQNEWEKIALTRAYLEKRAKTPFPEVEHIAVHHRKKGNQQLWFVLGSRQYIAIQRWKGNTEYSHADYILEVVQNMGEMPVQKKKRFDINLTKIKFAINKLLP